MARTKTYPLFQVVFCSGLLAGAIFMAPDKTAYAQQTTQMPSSQSASSQATPATAPTVAPHRRVRRRYVSPSSTSTSQAATQQQTVGPTAAQRRRDAQILAAQQKQSAEIARQQAIVTGNVIKERQAQQAEPRIQDAPGPGSQPLPGAPAVIAKQPSDPSGIQDAPGPAQTLPQAPAAPTSPSPQQ